MSSRFNNLIKIVVDKFEDDEYNLLLNEALSLTQIQDQLKEKGLDPTQYNSKHHLFILSLLNSNLSLEIYNQIITNIKDQGILNRLMSQTVDRRSNTPTVDVEIINRVIHNYNNIPELNAILNSITQKREVATPPASEEDKAKGLEDFATRVKKEVDNNLKKKFTKTEEYEYISKLIYQLIEDQKKLLPNDRLVQNYSYALPLASYFLNLPSNEDTSKIGRLLYDLFPRYMADDDIREKKLIFSEPYKSNFYEFSNYLYKYLRDKRFKKKDKTDNLMNDWVFRNEDVTVYAGTVEDANESVKRCIKYGKGVNPKYGLCISGSSAASHYANYRFEGARKNLTTYFVYFNKPEDINHYNSEFFLFEPFNDADNNNVVSYQYNPGAGNPGETRVTPKKAFEKYPMLEKPFEEGVFKVLPVGEDEKKNFDKIRNAQISTIENVDDLIDWIELRNPPLNSESFESIQKKFPEGLTYVIDFYLKRRFDFAEDYLQNEYVLNGGTLESYMFRDIRKFFNNNPELEKRYDKFKTTLKPEEIRIMTSSGGRIDSDYMEMIYNDYPNLVESSLDKYIKARKDNWTPSSGGELYFFVFAHIESFLDKHPEYREKYSQQMDDMLSEEMKIIMNAGEYLTSELLEKISKRYPDKVEYYLDQYINKRITQYFERKMSFLDDYVFNNIQGFINSKPELREKYKVSRELRQKEIDQILESQTLISSTYLLRLKNEHPDLLSNFLDRYINLRAEEILKLENNSIYTSLDNVINNLYHNITEFMTSHKEIRERYVKYEKELILNNLRLIGSQVIGSADLVKIQNRYPDILEEFIQIYLNKKIKYVSNIKYDGETGYYVTKDSNQAFDYEDLDELFINSGPTMQGLDLFLKRKDNEQLQEKFSPLINELKSIFAINKIILTEKVLNSEDAKELQNELSEDKFEEVLSKYFDSRINTFTEKIEHVQTLNNHSLQIPPRCDLEEHLFFPLREFFYYNPKLAAKFKDTQEALKYKAFEYCGKSEDYFSSGRSNEYYENYYLTSGWLQDVKDRFPDILEMGLDIYLFQKLRQSQVYRYVENPDSYDRENVLVNIESEVFKRIQEFEEKNKSLFEKYTKERMICIKAYIDEAKFNDILNSQYFFRLERTFRPTFYRAIFKKYIDKKLEFIKKVKSDKERNNIYHDNYVSEYRKVSAKDLYGYIFDPLEEFLETHPELIEHYGEKTKDIKYDFLLNYLTNKSVSTDLKAKAIKYINYLNNNEEDNTAIYYKIFNSLYMKFRYEKYSSSEVIEAFEEFYKKIDDKNTFEKVFLMIMEDKEESITFLGTFKPTYISFLDNLFIDNLYKNLFSIDNDNFIAIHELIKSKVKTSKLPYSNPSSFYKIINRIAPDFLDTILQETLMEQDGTRTPTKNILNVFFSVEYVYDYINNNQKLKDLLFKFLNSVDITNFNLADLNRERLGQPLFRFFEFIQQYPDFENSKAYKMAIEFDQKQIQKFEKEIQNSANNTLDHRYLDLFFFKEPPNLNNVSIKSSYTSDCTIKISSIFPIESLKFLPQMFVKPCKLEIRNCVLKNNIDYIPLNTELIELNRVTVSPDKDLISKDTSSFDPELYKLSLIEVKNLKTLKGLNNLTKLSILDIIRCQDLVSLKGSPSKLIEFTISTCDNIKNFKGGPLEVKNSFNVNHLNGLVNFVGSPKGAYTYLLNHTRINSFKGLPDTIKNLKFNDSISFRNLIRKSYSYFPSRIKHLTLVDYNEDKGSKSTYERYLFSRILNVFPFYIGNIDDFLPEYRQDSFWNKVRKAYEKNSSKAKNKQKEEIETAERIKQERTPTKEDEIEAIEKQQDKIANREKIKRLSKEELELITPFNVLLEDIMNTIRTSFKVYK